MLKECTTFPGHVGLLDFRPASRRPLVVSAGTIARSENVDAGI